MACMNRESLEGLLNRIGEARVGLVGDVCLDMYWRADMRLSELSRETPHHPLPVVEERMSPGGAGNVAWNLAALKPKALKTLGLIGRDWRGNLLTQALEERGVDASLLIRDESVCTSTYIKPLRSGISDVVYEDPRIDFENRRLPPARLEKALLDALERVAGDVDVLLVSDQLAFGCVTAAVRERLCDLGRAGLVVAVDSRSRIGEYRNVIVKPNEVEAARAFGGEADFDSLALAAARHTGRPAVLTVGGGGCLVAQGDRVVRLPAVPVPPPIDTVGAGDTFLAALGCALAAGGTVERAGFTANLAASVTVRMLAITGAATREAILRAFDCRQAGDT